MEQLKTITLQGKSYMQVVTRLDYFRKHYKDGVIKTSYEVVNGAIIMTANVIIDGKVKATGHALKSLKQELNLERCETRAIGRALAISGIGLDAGISSYEEVKEYIDANKKMQNMH